MGISALESVNFLTGVCHPQNFVMSTNNKVYYVTSRSVLPHASLRTVTKRDISRGSPSAQCPSAQKARGAPIPLSHAALLPSVILLPEKRFV